MTAPRARRRKPSTANGTVAPLSGQPQYTARLAVPVVIDTREQLGYGFTEVRRESEETDDVRDDYQPPYTFDGIAADQGDGGGLLEVPMIVDTLPSGDYSLRGYENRIAIERKSVGDLFRTVSQERKRFIAELERLNEFSIAFVMVEAEWSEILSGPPKHCKLPPLTIHRSVTAWEQRYPRVHWRFMPGRSAAEITTVRILQRFLKDEAERMQKTQQAQEAIK